MCCCAWRARPSQRPRLTLTAVPPHRRPGHQVLLGSQPDRARAHVAARRPRGIVSPAETRDALEAFQRAVETADLQQLLGILAPGVVLLGDGGGVVQAALAPIVGAAG
jgi:hypothetical protein